MTKPKPKPKTPQQLADEHWNFIEGLIFTQMKLTMFLFKEGFTHGYRHGKESNIVPSTTTRRVRTKPTKK